MNWVLLTTAPNTPIAESWAALLRGQGIPAHVSANTVSMLYGGGLMPSQVRVPEECLAVAKKVFNNLVGQSFTEEDEPKEVPPS